MKRYNFLFTCVVTSLILTNCSGVNSVDAAASNKAKPLTQSKRSTKSHSGSEGDSHPYWTKERMRNAKPVEGFWVTDKEQNPILKGDNKHLQKEKPANISDPVAPIMNDSLVHFIKLIVNITYLHSTVFDKTGVSDEIRTKDIDIKVISEKGEQDYLIELGTKGKQIGNSAILPKAQLAIVNARNKTKMKLHLNTEYTIKVSEAYVKDLGTFFYRKKNGVKVTGQLLKQIQVTPRTDTNLIEIKMD